MLFLNYNAKVRNFFESTKFFRKKLSFFNTFLEIVLLTKFVLYLN